MPSIVQMGLDDGGRKVKTPYEDSFNSKDRISQPFEDVLIIFVRCDIIVANQEAHQDQAEQEKVDVGGWR